MTRQLIYFDGKGFGEPIRYLLHYGGLEFEDVRLSGDDWPKYKEANPPPFGKLPIFKDGDRTMNQSVAIARYIGRTLGLVPTDPWEEASLDAVLFTINDFMTSMSAFFRESDPVKKEEFKKQILDETYDYYVSRFEKILKENNGHFGKKLSWVDFVFVNLLDITNEKLKFEFQDKYPNVKSLMNKIQNLPKVKEYIDSRKK